MPRCNRFFYGLVYFVTVTHFLMIPIFLTLAPFLTVTHFLTVIHLSSCDPFFCSWWSVARAFPPSSFSNSIFGSQRRTLCFKWSKTLQHLNWKKVFFIFFPFQKNFWLFWKVWWRKWHLFLVTTLNIWKAVFKRIQVFLSQKNNIYSENPMSIA